MSSVANISAVFALKGLEPAFVRIPLFILVDSRFVWRVVPPTSPFLSSSCIVTPLPYLFSPPLHHCKFPEPPLYHSVWSRISSIDSRGYIRHRRRPKI